jgi:cytochrome c-type biogenesis protein CcsB
MCVCVQAAFAEKPLDCVRPRTIYTDFVSCNYACSKTVKQPSPHEVAITSPHSICMSFVNIFSDYQSGLTNLSFLLLLVSFIFYWVRTIGSSANKVFAVNGLPETANSSSAQTGDFSLGTVVMVGANLCLCTLMILRWQSSGHFPLSNLYESLIFLSWCCTVLHLVLEKWSNVPWLGSLTSPIALWTQAFATFSLPSDMQQSNPLVPALQSNWLMMHVTVMILSYAALIVGALLSIGYLVLLRFLQKLPNSATSFAASTEGVTHIDDVKKLPAQKEMLSAEQVNEVPFTEEVQLAALTAKTERNAFSPPAVAGLNWQIQIQILDQVSYRLMGIGFAFLTIGILSGAVWANEAWGSYWSWDPKETWALLTWFVFAIYLHTRLNQGWAGEKSAWIASIGFFTVWICFLGVNLLGEGLHSYGFFSS